MARKTTTTPIDAAPATAPALHENPAYVETMRELTTARAARNAAEERFRDADSRRDRTTRAEAKDAVRAATKLVETLETRLTTTRRDHSTAAYADAKHRHADLILDVYAALERVQDAIRRELEFRNNLASAGVDRRTMFKPTTVPVSNLLFLIQRLDVDACRRRLAKVVK